MRVLLPQSPRGLACSRADPSRPPAQPNAACAQRQRQRCKGRAGPCPGMLSICPPLPSLRIARPLYATSRAWSSKRLSVAASSGRISFRDGQQHVDMTSTTSGPSKRKVGKGRWSAAPGSPQAALPAICRTWSHHRCPGAAPGRLAAVALVCLAALEMGPCPWVPRRCQRRSMLPRRECRPCSRGRRWCGCCRRRRGGAAAAALSLLAPRWAAQPLGLSPPARPDRRAARS